MESGLEVSINLFAPHLAANDTQAYICLDVIIVPSTVFIVALKTTAFEIKIH